MISSLFALGFSSKGVYIHLERFNKRPTLIHTGISFTDEVKTIRYDFRSRPFHTGTYETTGVKSECNTRTIKWGETCRSWEDISRFELEQLCTKQYVLGVYDCRHYTRDFIKWSCPNLPLTPVWKTNELWDTLQDAPLTSTPDGSIDEEPRQNNIRAIIGADVGLSLVISQYSSHHSITPLLVFADLCIAHSIYGRDRLVDQKNPSIVFQYTTIIALILTCCIFTETGEYELVPIMTFLSLGYKDVKPKLKTFKPIFIGFLWAYVIVYAPFSDYLVTTTAEDEQALFIFFTCLYSASSNLADIKDIEQDKNKNVMTIPSKYGENVTYLVSGLLVTLSLYVHTKSQIWTEGDWFNEIVAFCILITCIVKRSK